MTNGKTGEGERNGRAENGYGVNLGDAPAMRAIAECSRSPLFRCRQCGTHVCGWHTQECECCGETFCPDCYRTHACA